MLGKRGATVAVAAVFFASALAVLGSFHPADAARQQAGDSQAAVIVDTGSSVIKKCITFSGTISGIQALQLAGMNPQTYGFGSLGGAVCSLNGHGCSADSTCLTCGGSSYWAYHQASAGGGFQYSRGGASNSTVSDGGVEGWQWGSGEAPSFTSAGAVCGGGAPSSPQGGTGESSGGGGASGGTNESGSSGSGGTSGSSGSGESGDVSGEGDGGGEAAEEAAEEAADGEQEAQAGESSEDAAGASSAEASEVAASRTSDTGSASGGLTWLIVSILGGGITGATAFAFWWRRRTSNASR